MSKDTWPKAKLTTVAEFPPGFFLENIAVRSDNSVLITVVWQGELWFVRSPKTEKDMHRIPPSVPNSSSGNAIRCDRYRPRRNVRVELQHSP
jgi:hypothetical protein